MPDTLRDLKDEADKRLAEGKTLEALKVYRLVLEGAPLDFELRLEIGDLIASLNTVNLALAVFKAVAEHDIKSGNPLRAISALKRSTALGGDMNETVSELTDKYAAHSSAIGRGIKAAPANYSAKLRKGIDIDYDIDKKKLILETAQMAAYTENIEKYPAVVPPVPIFSTLEQDAFEELLKRLDLKRFEQGETIIKQGETGHALYFVARGEVSVIKTVTDSDGDPKNIHLARLGPGSLFGEMALVSADPRSASVVCDTAVDALELTRDRVEELVGKMPQVGAAMGRFTRERMISNLLATHPLFKPFDEETGKQLLALFTGHEVPKGTTFLEQNTVGNGLYIILQGRAEVLKWDSGQYIKVADLGPGDVAGEISLLYEEPVTATVRTTSPATLLFLARELFKPLVDSIPDLLVHFNKLAEERLADTASKVMEQRVIEDDFIEELDEDVDLCGDDAVFI